MNNLIIKGERGEFYTPSINFNAQTGVCEIVGESYLEYTREFYAQLMQWFKAYLAGGKPLILNIRLTYFNTSSFKSISEMLKMLKGYQSQGSQIEVNWYYPEDDDDMLKEAEDLEEGTDIEMNFIPYPFEE